MNYFKWWMFLPLHLPLEPCIFHPWKYVAFLSQVIFSLFIKISCKSIHLKYTIGIFDPFVKYKVVEGG